MVHKPIDTAPSLVAGQRHRRAAPWAHTAALLALLAVAPAAFAQTFICPTGPGPGQRQVGMSGGGGGGLAPVPVCTQDAAPGGGAPQQQAAPREDPLIGYARAMGGMMKNQAEEIRRLEQDPEFRAMRAGSWAYFGGDKGSPPGDNCIAIFKSLAGAVQVSGPSGDYRGASLTFFGLDIPKPAKPDTLRVKLDQGEGNVQEVSAINYAAWGGKMGAITFQVPTFDSALKGMRDKEHFKVSIQDKPVIDVGYHSGLKARDQLRLCAAGKTMK